MSERSESESKALDVLLWSYATQLHPGSLNPTDQWPCEAAGSFQWLIYSKMLSCIERP